MPKSVKLRRPAGVSAAVRQWGLSFIVERETALDRRIRSQIDVESLRP